jgi:hypothetical protein
MTPERINVVYLLSSEDLGHYIYSDDAQGMIVPSQVLVMVSLGLPRPMCSYQKVRRH